MQYPWYNLYASISIISETKVVIEDTLYGNSITSLCECVHVSVYVCVVCVSVSNGSQWLGVYRLACTFCNWHGSLFHKTLHLGPVLMLFTTDVVQKSASVQE